MRLDGSYWQFNTLHTIIVMLLVSACTLQQNHNWIDGASMGTMIVAMATLQPHATISQAQPFSQIIIKVLVCWQDELGIHGARITEWPVSLFQCKTLNSWERAGTSQTQAHFCLVQRYSYNTRWRDFNTLCMQVNRLTRGRLPLLALAISSVAEEHPPPNIATTVWLIAETTPSLNSSTALVLLHCPYHM